MEIQLDYTPFDYQLDLHKDTSRFRIISGGRRVGKTKCCIQEVIKHCLSDPNRLVFWISPTFRDAREVGFEEFLQYEEDLRPAISKIHLTQYKVSFANGSAIYFKGSDNPDSLRGRGLSLVVCDEFAFFKPGVFSTVVRPSLSDKQGRAILISTPNGLSNEFYDFYHKDNGWSKYKWITELNPLITSTELDEVKSEISSIDYRQEYLGEFITKAGRVYDDFGDDNIVPLPAITGEHDIYMGCDFGFASRTAIILATVNRVNNIVHIFDEIYVSREQMDSVITLIELKLAEHSIRKSNLKYLYTDPAGNAEELSSGLSPVDMLRSRDFTVVNKGSNIAPGLELVRSFIKNVKGDIKMFVDPRCEETIRSFRGYQYKITAGGQAIEEAFKDNIHDHLMDAVRYFFVNRFDKAKYVAKTLNSMPYSAQVSTKCMKRCNICHKPFISNTAKTQPPYVCTVCAGD